MSATNCSKNYDATKLHPTFIYPKDNYAMKYDIAQSCPVKAGKKVQLDLNDESLQGAVCFVGKEAMDIRREWESNCQ